MKIRLEFTCVSEIIGCEDMCLLILVDESRLRQLSIVCDKTMGVQIDLRVRELPITGIMLPEVLCSLLKACSDSTMELLIHDLINGQYAVSLCVPEKSVTIPIRASDAVLLSLIGNIPLYIDSSLMARQSVAYHKNAAGISIPVNTLSDDMLQSALDKAIDNENYELASHLNNEKKRRKKNTSDVKGENANEGD